MDAFGFRHAWSAHTLRFSCLCSFVCVAGWVWKHKRANALAMSSTTNRHEHTLGCVHSYCSIDLIFNRCKAHSFHMLTLLCDTAGLWSHSHRPAQTGHTRLSLVASQHAHDTIVCIMIHAYNSVCVPLCCWWFSSKYLHSSVYVCVFLIHVCVHSSLHEQ